MTSPRDLSIADFTYVLPEAHVAQQPLGDRDASRLLVYKDGRIRDHPFVDLPELLPKGALLVLNNTRVVNARLFLYRESGARIEVLCLEPWAGVPVEQAFAQQGRCEWHAFTGNSKRWKNDEELVVRAMELELKAARNGPERIAFSWTPTSLTFAEVLERIGHVPLPPYMKRPDEDSDKERYNTVFARHEGSVAAPTASLHFTPGLLGRIQARGIGMAELTLHVGAGTFLPVKSELMKDHAMHREQVRVPLRALELLRERLGNGPVIPIGTTALRTLESIYWHGAELLFGTGGPELDIGQWEPYEHSQEGLPTPIEALDAVIHQVRSKPDQRLIGSTAMLIAPGYDFRFADALVTNFHQPQSTLLLLVAAFLGPDWRAIYEHALASGYRFLSYGDTSLLFRNDQRSRS
ncbi:MAG: S-adenosylmethionine:tRNA ribosyltransferase-isomerase [Flavobacteriales bacterium]|nr:S-adenosylmethionine:tRNA ribosyltransferase-isomerase [Flavobacteriales bacterium]